MNKINPVENDLQVQHSESIIFTIMGVVFLVIGTLVLLLRLLVDENISFGTNNVPYQSAFIIGNIIGNILIVTFIVCIAIFVFKKKKRRALMILSIIFLVLSCITTTNAFVVRVKENKLNKIAMDKLISICRDYANGNDLKSEKLEKSKYGSMSPFLDLSNQYFISYKKLATDMNTEVVDINIATILGSDTYSSSEKINDAQKKVQLLISAFDKFEGDSDKIQKDMKQDVNNLDIPIRYKKGVVDGFEDGQIESSSKIKKYILFEKNFGKKINDNLSFMLEEKGNYEVKNNLIYFSSNDDLNKYNIFISDIQKLATEEASIVKEMQQSTNKQLDKLENLNK